MVWTSFRRLSSSGTFLAVAVLTACSPKADNLLDVPASPEPAVSVQAQHAANLAAIEAARQAADGRYADLKAAWAARDGGSRPMTAASTSSGTFVACAPLPFDGQAQIIGSGGGTFSFGPHRLYVPAGALSQATSIAVMVDPDLKTRVTLLPHGLKFVSPVKLVLAYDHCDPSATHRVAYIDGYGKILEWTVATDYPEYEKVTAKLDHFSDYAIAY